MTNFDFSSHFNTEITDLERDDEGNSDAKYLFPEGKSTKITDYTVSMLPFIPVTIMHQLTSFDKPNQELPSFRKIKSAIAMQFSKNSRPSQPQSYKLPLCFPSKSVVLVGEIRNFYDQTKYDRSVDLQSCHDGLADTSHKLLTIISPILNKYRGDCIQFHGCSFFATWPGYETLDKTLLKDYPVEETYRQDICRQAAQCAYDIKREVGQVLGKGLELGFGLGFGDMQVCHAGGVFKRVEFFIVGTAVLNALRALGAVSLAKGKKKDLEDNIIIAASREVQHKIKQFIYCEELTQNLPQSAGENEDDQAVKKPQVDFYQVRNIKQKKNYKRNNYLKKDSIDESKIRDIQMILKSYIPGAFRQLSQLKGKSKFGQDDKISQRFGQHLRQTVMAMAIDLNIHDMNFANGEIDARKNGNESLGLLQEIIEIVQTQVYRMEGSVTKIISYEGGLQVYAVWGMQFLSHQNDCARALFAAQNIRKRLIQFQLDCSFDSEDAADPPVHIGIATGSVFQVVVGDYNRREIVAVGEAVERAKALMLYSSEKYGKVSVDFDTRQAAQHELDFRYVEHIGSANKVYNESVYEPVSVTGPPGPVKETKGKLKTDEDSAEDSISRKLSAKYQASLIKIHSNPFFIDRNNSYQKNFNDIYGRYEMLDNIVQDIELYVQEHENSDPQLWALAVRGEMGSGKSLFSRRLILEISKKEKSMLDPLKRTINTNFCFRYIVCTCTSNINLKFIGIWRPFLRALLEIYSLKKHKSREYIINSQISKGRVQDKVEAIEKIFGLKHLSRNINQQAGQTSEQKSQKSTPQPKINLEGASNTGAGVVGRERLGEAAETDILIFCHDFIINVLKELKETTFFVVVFDNCSQMNAPSWRLFDLLAQNPVWMVLIMNLKTQSNFFEERQSLEQRAKKVMNPPSCRNNSQSYMANSRRETLTSPLESLNFEIFPGDEEAILYYKQSIEANEREIFALADMSPLEPEDMEQALIMVGPRYEEEMTEEIELLVKMTGLQKQVKNPEGQRERFLKLLSKYHAYSHFKAIQKIILDQLVSKCYGNPMRCFFFAYQLIYQGFAQIENHILKSSIKLKNSIKLENQTSLELPYWVFKKNSILLEDALNPRQQKHGKHKLENSAILELVQLLQSAAIIGDVFGTNMLQYINQFNVKTGKNYPVLGLLRELEDRDLIEELYDENQGSVDPHNQELINQKKGQTFYRFNHPFMREMLYQMQPFDIAKKPSHEKVIEYMQNNSVLDYTTNWSVEKEQMMMLRHAMQAEQNFNEEKLSLKARQCLAIKRINQNMSNSSMSTAAILTSRMDLYFEPAKSQGIQAEDRPEVFVSLKAKSIEWYKRMLSEDEEKKAIMHILPDNQQELESDEETFIKKNSKLIQQETQELLQSEDELKKKRSKALMTVFEMFVAGKPIAKQKHIFQLQGSVELKKVEKVKGGETDKANIESNQKPFLLSKLTKSNQDPKDANKNDQIVKVNYFTLKCKKWNHTQQGNQDSATLTFIQQNETKKRETEDWIVSVEYLRTKLHLDNFNHQYNDAKFEQSGPNQNFEAQDREFNKGFGSEFQKVVLNTGAKNQLEASRELGNTIDEKNLNDSFRASVLTKGDIKNKLKSKKQQELLDLSQKLKLLYQVSNIHFLEHIYRHTVKPNQADEAFTIACNTQNLGQMGEPLKQTYSGKLSQFNGLDYSGFGITSKQNSTANKDHQTMFAQESFAQEKKQIRNKVFKTQFQNSNANFQLNPSEEYLPQEERDLLLLYGLDSRKTYISLKMANVDDSNEFMEGSQVYTTKLVPIQESNHQSGDKFTIKRRIDRSGYNDFMKPFGVQGNPKFATAVKMPIQLEGEEESNNSKLTSVTKQQYAHIDPKNQRIVKGQILGKMFEITQNQGQKFQTPIKQQKFEDETSLADRVSSTIKNLQTPLGQSNSDPQLLKAIQSQTNMTFDSQPEESRNVLNTVKENILGESSIYNKEANSINSSFLNVIQADNLNQDSFYQKQDSEDLMQMQQKPVLVPSPQFLQPEDQKKMKFQESQRSSNVQSLQEYNTSSAAETFVKKQTGNFKSPTRSSDFSQAEHQHSKTQEDAEGVLHKVIQDDAPCFVLSKPQGYEQVNTLQKGTRVYISKADLNQSLLNDSDKLIKCKLILENDQKLQLMLLKEMIIMVREGQDESYESEIEDNNYSLGETMNQDLRRNDKNISSQAEIVNLKNYRKPSEDISSNNSSPQTYQIMNNNMGPINRFTEDRVRMPQPVTQSMSSVEQMQLARETASFQQREITFDANNAMHQNVFSTQSASARSARSEHNMLPMQAQDRQPIMSQLTQNLKMQQRKAIREQMRMEKSERSSMHDLIHGKRNSSSPGRSSQKSSPGLRNQAFNQIVPPFNNQVAFTQLSHSNTSTKQQETVHSHQKSIQSQLELQYKRIPGVMTTQPRSPISSRSPANRLYTQEMPSINSVKGDSASAVPRALKASERMKKKRQQYI